MKRLWQPGSWLTASLFVALAVSGPADLTAQQKSKAAFESKVISRETKGHAVDVEVNLDGAQGLWLVALDAGDGFGCDWADWAEPRLVGPKGELKLTDLKWASASTGFGQVRVNQNCSGSELKIGGQPVSYGIGTHANSIIEFAIPEGYTTFKARAGIDDGGANQGCGSTVQFAVYTQKPAGPLVSTASAGGAGSRDPQDAVAGLDVADGLEATLFASEASNPPMLNPTSIDIDHLGRVWVCEVVNYRHRLGERPAGDRILVLEDTDGDGVADKQTVFHQGRDVDTAHGICVLPTPDGKGTKIIVSCGDSVFFLHDDDGDLKSDRKELLFTGIQGTQHDHGIHAFHFGPDGKLYFNFGNSGRLIKDKSGNPIIDLAGNEVNDAKSHYQEGMVFRCNMDGSEFETLGWNFRNNWEIAVDSFGSLWQSDNDDDGNKGVRINFVMEFGNYGYKDEITRAGWQSPRTNLEQEIPLRHWHLNDPGVVPNLLQTGAGSPTGIVVYEGDLLPEVFRNQVIHCDAGPNVVRAYPVKKSGAGYSAETVNILTGARDNWFRPSDVCVAPDGSLIVADWYDPGVGGHRMGDADKGRLFRVAPPKTPYRIPKVDVSTVEGAIAALKSPNEATRYLAWNALHAMGEKAEGALAKVFESDANPRVRARALWLLCKNATKGETYVRKAVRDPNPDIRVAAVRVARQLDMKKQPLNANIADYSPKASPGDKMNVRLRLAVLSLLVVDRAPEVRRECLIALRDLNTDTKDLQGRNVDSMMWAFLAMPHDGKDRWYLEALGIGAGNDWDACLEAYMKAASQPHQDIIWRSRGKQTPALLAKMIADSSITAESAPRFLRAFDFLPASQEKDDALVQLAFATSGDEQKAALVSAEALNRLKGFDVSKNQQQKAALNRVLDSLKGQPQFVTLVEKFSVADRYNDLLLLAIEKPDDQIGIDAIRVLLNKEQQNLFAAALLFGKPTDKPEVQRATLALATVLSNSGDGRAAQLLLPVVESREHSADVRRQAIKGATRTKPGATAVLSLAEKRAFDETFAPALAAALTGSNFPDIREAGLKLFPPPAGKNDKPLPPVGELAKMKGNTGNGAKLFATTGKCASCHVVNGQGKEVGPNLSEIGSKLSRQALFESIIYPSAGISHNFETYSAELADGTVFNGILVSQTDESVTLRNNEAITRTIAKKDVEELTKSKISLMPADLAKLLSVEEIADVVEYLTTLKKK